MSADELREEVGRLRAIADRLGEMEAGHRETERALTESERKYRHLVENTNDIPYTLDADGKLSYVGPQIRQFGMEPENVLENGFWGYVFPEDAERLEREIERSLKRGEEFRTEFRLVDGDGRVYWMEDQGKVSRDEDGAIIGVSGVLHDITGRREAERALREEREKLAKITGSARDAVIMTDDKGMISFWNPAAEKIFGYSGAEALGQELHAFLAPQRFHDEYRRGFARFQQEGSGPAVGRTLELEAIRKGGEEFPIELSLSAVNIRGTWHAVGIVRDITGRKALARRLIEAQEEERRRISGQLHDDIGQLLTAVKIRVDRLLKAGGDTGELRAELSGISDVLSTILNKTRALSRQLSPLLLDQLGLGPVLRSLCSEFSDHTGIDVQVEAGDGQYIPKETGMVIYRVVQESLTNVAKHAGAGKVYVKLGSDADFTELLITDDGRGFDVAAANSRRDCLGLRSIRKRVSDSGGDFFIRSAPEEGTTLMAMIPQDGAAGAGGD